MAVILAWCWNPKAAFDYCLFIVILGLRQHLFTLCRATSAKRDSVDQFATARLATICSNLPLATGITSPSPTMDGSPTGILGQRTLAIREGWCIILVNDYGLRCDRVSTHAMSVTVYAIRATFGVSAIGVGHPLLLWVTCPEPATVISAACELRRFTYCLRDILVVVKKRKIFYWVVTTPV